MNNINIMDDQYQRAIEARNNHNDNYNKWMVYYFTSNGAILVAICTLISNSKALILLSILGVLVSIFWHLSCKGFYYWTLNWIKIIKRLERDYIKSVKPENTNLYVYCSFSEKLKEDTKRNFLNPIKPANISTPKLTMIFAFISILLWVSFLIFLLYSSSCMCENIFYSISIISISAIVYLCIALLFESIKEKDDDFEYF